VPTCSHTILIFTAGSGPAPNAGTFTYDSTNNDFTAFTVTWDGIGFDLKTSANSPDAFSPCGSTAHDAFIFLTAGKCGTTSEALRWNADSGGSEFDLKGFSGSPSSSLKIDIFAMGPSQFLFNDAMGGFSTSAVPEPSHMLLLTIACGAMLMVGKRRFYRGPKATPTTQEELP
jgi:hypothetical protein